MQLNLHSQKPPSVIDLVFKATRGKALPLPVVCGVYHDCHGNPAEPVHPAKAILFYDADGNAHFLASDDSVVIQDNLTVVINGDIHYLRALFTEPGLDFFIAQASPWYPDYGHVHIFPMEQLLVHPYKN